MTDTAYRLPDWLGGNEVRILDEMVGWGFPAVTVEFVGEPREPMVVARSWLTEIKPPSIDDRVPLPLNIFDSENDASLHLEAQGDRTELWVRVRGEHIKHAGGVFDYHDSALDLKPADLRDLARAAWQRANAIERA